MKINATLMQVIGCSVLILAGSAVPAQQNQPGLNSCTACHGDAAKMKEQGFPGLSMTQQDVEKQTHMPASCTDCHLGNPTDPSKGGAHKGLLRLSIVSTKGLQAQTRDKLANFKPATLGLRGKNQMTELLPQVEKDGKLVKDPEVNTILFHDKNPDTLSFNYPALEKTCGVCHKRQIEELQKTAMGHNAKQRLYKTWTGKQGPHNCGVWFAEGYDEIAKDTKGSFTKEESHINQKACNLCHTGCLDCHSAPSKKDPQNANLGSHTFTKIISA